MAQYCLQLSESKTEIETVKAGERDIESINTICCCCFCGMSRILTNEPFRIHVYNAMLINRGGGGIIAIVPMSVGFHRPYIIHAFM